MPNDSFYTQTFAPAPAGDSFSTATYAPSPQGDAFTIGAYIDTVVYNEPFLISLAPDPATYTQTLTITGIALDRVRAVIIDGQGMEFTRVNSTTITVVVPQLTPGIKSVHVEYI